MQTFYNGVKDCVMMIKYCHLLASCARRSIYARCLFCLCTAREETVCQNDKKRVISKDKLFFFQRCFFALVQSISLHSFPTMVCIPTGLAKSRIWISRVRGLHFGSCLSRKQSFRESSTFKDKIRLL